MVVSVMEKGRPGRQRVRQLHSLSCVLREDLTDRGGRRGNVQISGEEELEARESRLVECA